MSTENGKRIRREELTAFTSQILDIFEDFLESRNINIDNSDKQDAILSGQDPETICILYGTDYGELASGIEDVLYNWDLIDTEERSNSYSDEEDDDDI